MTDDSFREFIANRVRKDAADTDEPAEADRVRAPGTAPGIPTLDRPGWKDPDRRRRGTRPPGGAGVRSARF